MKTNLIPVLALTLVPIFNSPLTIAQAQGTAFTYQGRLNASGAPASGSYDLVFTLYTTNTTGSALAGPVTNGLFTTFVDFGPGVFTGASNWLAIAVSTNAANSFSTLAPRQQLTPVPFAITAANLSGSIAPSSISGTIPLAQLPQGLLTNNATAITLSGNLFGNFGGTFFGNGGGLTNLSASQLTSGTLADARLSGNVALLNGNQTFTGSNTFVTGNFNCAFAGNSTAVTNVNLLSVNSDGAIVWTTTNGGGFTLPSTLFVGGNPASLVTADVNGDGRPDLISVGNYTGTTCTVRSGRTTAAAVSRSSRL
jgi:hypothetical protein